jgi:hypothetical protein
MASSKESTSTETTLNSRQDWTRWFSELQFNAQFKGIWYLIDPDAEDAPHVSAQPIRNVPEIDAMISQEQARRTNELLEWTTMLSPEQQAEIPRPVATTVTFNDIEKLYNARLREYTLKSTEWNNLYTKYTAIWNWINATVKKSLLEPIERELVTDQKISIQELVRRLKANLGISTLAVETNVREEYKNILAQARQGNTNPQTWYEDWYKVYLQAKVLDIPEVKGVLATKEFLTAIGVKMAPTWAQTEYTKVLTNDHLNLPQTSLEDYGRIFSALAYDKTTRKDKSLGIFATLGKTLSGNQHPNTPKEDTERVPNSTEEAPNCPCNLSQKRPHKWPPEECRSLQRALDNPDEERSQKVLERLYLKKYQSLLKELQKKKKDIPKKPTSTSGNVTSANKDSKRPSKQLELQTSHNAVTLDPILFVPTEHQMVFSTLDFSRHPFSDSTLLDNCGAAHIVNDESLLEKDTFTGIEAGTVECGSSSLPIVGRGTRVIRNCLRGPEGENTADLILKDVAVVRGFHVNIISEAKLRQAKLWVHGYDGTLRFGTDKENIVVKTLVRKCNVNFFEYKPLSTYSNSQVMLQRASYPPLIYSSTHRQLNKKFRSVRNWLKPRSDSEDIWHQRAGHLGQDALQALVKNARNVVITGIPRRKCKHCSVTHAEQVISRRPVTQSSARPYWRIGWDLFEYTEGYNGSLYLLLIKEEFSGQLKGFQLKDKSLQAVFSALKDFDQWVINQYGLYICKIKSDRDTSVISTRGTTEYQNWVVERGIDLELTPPDTHQPNGGSERAGKEVITKALKMQLGANLPEELWPECTTAAIYLYNRSPLASKAMRSPNEVLHTWFRTYFRWYDPATVTKLTMDLRPDWSGIYVYGCRAYPLVREREAGKHKRAFKVKARAHVGYLVGYEASNIYRIWVPSLKRVFITRNVTFDEETLYNPSDEVLIGQSVAITKTVVELIEEESGTQDAGSILQHMGLWDRIPDEHVNGGEGNHLQGGSTAPSQNSGVKGSRVTETGTGLLTPDITPEPSSSTSTKATQDTLDNQDTSGNSTDESQTPGREVHSPPTGTPQVVLRSWSSLNQAEKTAIQGTANEYQSSKSTTRRSRRIQQINQRKRGALVNTILSREGLPRHFRNFVLTFLPGIQLDKNPDEHLTVHAVIAASVLQFKSHRIQKAPAISRIHTSELPPVPKRYSELEKHPLGAQFREEMEVEIRNLEARDCWRVIDLSETKPAPVPMKWVYTYKTDSDGFVLRCRSRVVVRGDLQDEHTIESTYAATLAARSFRVAMAIAAFFDLEVKVFDVINAFINALRQDTTEPVVCALPDGFKRAGKAVVVDRALYGMRDSPALWYQDFSKTLKRLGLHASKEEPCLYITPDKSLYVVFFVDDVQVLYHKRNQFRGEKFINELKKAYELRDMGDIEWFLGVRVLRDRKEKRISLVHDTYIEKIARKFNLDDWKTPATPLPQIEFVKNTLQARPGEIKLYQEKVGSVLYTAIMIRPDIAYAVALLSQFLTNPSLEHMNAVDWIIRYLFGTRFLAVTYCWTSTKIQHLVIASDASFANDPETRRSSFGYIILLFGGPIIWKAARQDTVTTSTTEAEMLSLSSTAKETVALQRFFQELDLDLQCPYTIFCDNQQTIRLVVEDGGRIATKLRHVDIHNMWLKEQYSRGSFEVTYLPTNEMPADGLTKNLSRAKFEHFRGLLNLRDMRGNIEELH